MPDGNAKVQAYEQALGRVRDLDRKILGQMRVTLAPPDGTLRPGMRELAYTEGLRSERDAALEEARRLEAELFNEMLVRLTDTTSPTDSVK